jgi:hypothetical protein
MMPMFQLFYEAAPALNIGRRLPVWPELTLGGIGNLASWCQTSGLDRGKRPGLCLYTKSRRLDLISQQLIPYIHHGMAVRHHGYFPGKEIGHAHAAAAEDAMQLHFKAMEALQGIGEPGKRIGVTISLENLRRGPTANPQILLDWARRSGAGITLDVGHAVSSRCVCNKTISVEKIIDLVAARLMEVHVYESETDRHWAPRNMEILGPIVDRLIKTDCRWWTIELEDTRDVLLTRQLLVDHLRKTEKTAFWRPQGEAGCALPV